MVFGICRLIDILVPDVPESLEIKIKRERYLAKQALADTETIMKVCILIYCWFYHLYLILFNIIWFIYRERFTLLMCLFLHLML